MSRWKVSVAIAAAAILYGAAGLRYHGATSDSPSLFYAGDRTLFWMTHPGAPGALDFLGPDPAEFHTRFERDPEFKDPLHYPVFPGLVGAVTSQVFHDALGWTDVVDGHHLGLVFLHAFALFVECWFLWRLAGARAAVAATIALALFPSAIGHSFNNAKDWPCAQFYACAVLAAGAGLFEGRGRWLLASGVFAGLALSCKINGVFIFVTILLWTPLAYSWLYRGRRPLSAAVVGGFLAGPYVAGAVFVILWPWLYYGHARDWWGHFSEYVTFMVNYGSGARETWTAYPLRPLLFMTPPLVLACAMVYAATGWRGGRERPALWSLFGLWLAVPLVRIAAPRSNFYDANRHFIEYIPALAAMAGCGFDWLIKRAAPVLSARASVVTAIYAASIAVLIWPIVEYAPYETTYFNTLIGGLRGAQRAAVFTLDGVDSRIVGTEGDYWYNSLRHGLHDIRRAMHGGELIGLCGPDRALARIDWGNAGVPRFADYRDPGPLDQADFIYVMPRGVFCDPHRIERLEAGRKVLTRVERGGGLIYMVLARSQP